MRKEKVTAALKAIGIWIPTLLLAAVFVLQGLSKFSATSGWVDRFRMWGYPDWFRMAVGGAELLAGLLILVPRTAAIGAIIIMCIMLGGMGTHVLIEGQPRGAFREVIPFALATLVLYARRAELARLLGRG